MLVEHRRTDLQLVQLGEVLLQLLHLRGDHHKVAVSAAGHQVGELANVEGQRTGDVLEVGEAELLRRVQRLQAVADHEVGEDEEAGHSLGEGQFLG